MTFQSVKLGRSRGARRGVFCETPKMLAVLTIEGCPDNATIPLPDKADLDCSGTVGKLDTVNISVHEH